jgi:hypothetical protein
VDWDNRAGRDLEEDGPFEFLDNLGRGFFMEASREAVSQAVLPEQLAVGYAKDHLLLRQLDGLVGPGEGEKRVGVASDAGVGRTGRGDFGPGGRVDVVRVLDAEEGPLSVLGIEGCEIAEVAVG